MLRRRNFVKHIDEDLIQMGRFMSTATYVRTEENLKI